MDPHLMQHLESVNIAYAKSSCYRCGGADDCVDMDTFIIGEGALALCRICLTDAKTIAEAGYKKRKMRDRQAAVDELKRSKV